MNRNVETLAPILLMGLLLLLQLTPVDDQITQLFFDPNSRTFPDKSSFLFKVVLHDWARYPIFLIALASIGFYISTLVRPRLHKYREVMAFIVVSMLVTTSTIALLKHSSSIHCPYNLIDYGGNFHRVELLGNRFLNVQPGRCWPSGHASAGFCLMAFYFAGRHLGAQWAIPTLVIALAIGFTFTLSQTIRGAHFFSHGLWTALFCWLINTLLARTMLRQSGSSK